jgi:glutaredoxin
VRAKHYMQQRGLRFTEHDVDEDREAAARRDLLNPRGGVPTIQIDDKVMVGFDPERFQQMVDNAARVYARR